MSAPPMSQVIMQQLDAIGNKAVEAMSAMGDNIIGALGGFLDKYLNVQSISAGVDKLASGLNNISFGNNSLSSGLSRLNPFGKEKGGIEGPSQEIAQAVTPSRTQEVSGPEAPVVRNEKFDIALAAASFKPPAIDFKPVDMSETYGFSAALSGVGQEKSTTGIGVA